MRRPRRSGAHESGSLGFLQGLCGAAVVHDWPHRVISSHINRKTCRCPDCSPTSYFAAKTRFAVAPAERQLRSTTRSSFLLKIQNRPRNATSSAKARPEEASLITFSETWPKAYPAETIPQDQRPAATKLSARKVDQGSCDIPYAKPATLRMPCG